MRERVIAPIILILTLRGPHRPGRPGHPNSGDVRGCMTGQDALRDGLSRQPVLGWAGFTGFFLPAAWGWQRQFLRAADDDPVPDEGIHQAAADSRRRLEHTDLAWDKIRR